jgi:N-acetylglucosamine-6-phosphate deacetylase
MPILPGSHRDNVSIRIADFLIAAIGPNTVLNDSSETIDTAGLRIFPGFVDIHNHGAVGIDVNEADTEGLLEIAAFLGRKGVTAWLPTLVPDSDENYARVIAAIDRLMEVQADRPVAQALGVHYEGVFANEKMCGALRPEFFKRFTGSEIAELPRLKPAYT